MFGHVLDHFRRLRCLCVFIKPKVVNGGVLLSCSAPYTLLSVPPEPFWLATSAAACMPTLSSPGQPSTSMIHSPSSKR